MLIQIKLTSLKRKIGLLYSGLFFYNFKVVLIRWFALQMYVGVHLCVTACACLHVHLWINPARVLSWCHDASFHLV